MALPVLFPFVKQESYLLDHCKLVPHTGIGKIKRHGDSSNLTAVAIEEWRKAIGTPRPSELEFDCTFFVPPSGSAMIFLRGGGDARPNQNFGEEFTMKGICGDGTFELSCPQYYVRTASESKEEPAWAVAVPVNKVVTIQYGESRPIHRVQAIINNFDFDHGNLSAEHNEPKEGETLRVEASGRLVDFAWREKHDELTRLVAAKVLRTTALTTFSFEAWEGASEDDLTDFAHNVASLCGIVARQQTGVPVITFLDAENRAVKRLVGDPVESPYRPDYLLRFLHFDDALPKLFRECFHKHVSMRACDLWNRLPFLCAVIEDPPYLELKFTTLMTAVELLIRSTLIEEGHCSQEDGNKLTLPNLVKAATEKLGWDIPDHYTIDKRHKNLRNAVAHGNSLPEDGRKVRLFLEKWHLFLLRRFLIRLGYSGDVLSPTTGWVASSSSVDDFSEEHNSFGP